MRPYKKRVFFNPQNHDNAMEMDNSDDSETQTHSSPNAENTEKEKDKEGEPKRRKKWKRKVSRKQFRHHDIKLFTPGEYRSSTLLKQNDSAPSVSKKQTEFTKDSIIESIVSSLGGHKQGSPQSATQIREESEGINSKDGIEENNNMNSIKNHNNAGKHQLPAIVMETPKLRKRSLENIEKPATTRYKDQPTNADTLPQDDKVGTSAHEPVLQQSEVDPKPFDISMKNVLYGLKPSIRLSMDSDCSPKSSNELLGNNMETKRNTDEVILPDHHKVIHSSKVSLETSYQSQQMETNSCKRNSIEVPVDLSKKTNIHTQRNAELAKHAELMRQIDNFKNVARQPQIKFQNVNASINFRDVENKYSRTSQYYKLPLHDVMNSSFSEFRHSDNKYSKPPKDSVQKLLSNNAKGPVPILSKDCRTKPEPEVFRTTISKISKLAHLENFLRELLRQQFSTQVLNSMCHAFLQLDTAKDDSCIPLELKIKAEHILNETYNFIFKTLKNDLHLNWDIMEAIKTFGQSDGNIRQNQMTNNSDDMPVEVIRDLSINDAPKFSTNVFVPSNTQVNQIKGYSELHKPLLYSNARKMAKPHNQAINSLQSYSRILSPRAGDLPSSLDHSPSIPINERLIPKITEPPWIFPNNQTSADHYGAIDRSPFINSAQPTTSTAFQLPFPLPYMYNLPIDRSVATSQNSTSVGRSRSKSHKHLEITNGHPQFKRSFSNPHNTSNEYNNYPSGMEYSCMETSSPYIQPLKAAQNNVFRPQISVPTGYLQKNNLNISSPNIVQKLSIPPSYSKACFQSPKGQIVINPKMHTHSYPDYVKRISPTFSISQNPILSETQNSIMRNKPMLSPANEILEAPKTFVASRRIDSTPDEKRNIEVSNCVSKVAEQVCDNTKMMDFESPNNKEKLKPLPTVIVADKSMQITKEPTTPQKDTTINQDKIDSLKSDQHMSVITNIINSKTSSSEEIAKQNIEKERDENNSEFQVWLEKLKKNDKLKSKFLSQMGIIKKEEPTSDTDCIEIIDSDEEKSEVMPSNEILKRKTTVITSAPKEVRYSTDLEQRLNSMECTKPLSTGNVLLETRQKALPQDKTTKIIMPRNLQITPITPTSTSSNISKPQPRLTPKHSLSKRDYIPPIALPYQHSPATLETGFQTNTSESKKTIYSPEIEPISPPNNETTTFSFPEVKPGSKILSPTANSAERGIVLNDSVTSPSYVQKRKSSDFPDYPKDKPASSNRQATEYQLDNGSKRRKSLDRPQTSVSPRVAPSGKLSYKREKHMLVRYFDDTQLELYLTNTSSQDEELLRTTSINAEKLKNSFKSMNFYGEQIGKTEIVHLPKDVEFSTKEDLPDVEEFVKESSLVETFVPKDFADFYRYVTGFQIIKNKHPVSLNTFLTMYNTNRTTELLRKYLQRLDEDSSGAVIR